MHVCAALQKKRESRLHPTNKRSSVAHLFAVMVNKKDLARINKGDGSTKKCKNQASPILNPLNHWIMVSLEWAHVLVADRLPGCLAKKVSDSTARRHAHHTHKANFSSPHVVRDRWTVMAHHNDHNRNDSLSLAQQHHSSPHVVPRRNDHKGKVTKANAATADGKW